MTRLLLILGVIVTLPARVDAAWAAVSGQAALASGNDAEIALPGATTTGNIVFILAHLPNEEQTLSITGTTMAFAASVGPLDSAANDLRTYIFCATADGDNTYTVTTSGAGSAQSFAIEFSGGSCTLDGSTQSNDDTDDATFALTTDVTVTNSDSPLLGIIASTTAANFAPGTKMTQISTDGGGTAAEYRMLTASGDFDTPWTAAATEAAFLVGAAFQSDGVAAVPCIIGGGFFRSGCPGDEQ